MKALCEDDDEVPEDNPGKPVVFDPVLGELLKETGHAHAQEGSEFERRVEIARAVAKVKTTFTTDDVWAAIGSVPPGHDAPSGMGSVMRFLSQNEEIIWTGAYRKSARPEQHRKPIKVWRHASSNENK